MTTTPAGWYPDPEQPTLIRYWDGMAWTDHRAAGGLVAAQPVKLKPGLVGVWITAVLSLFTFWIRKVDASGQVSTTAIPVGIGFMIVCWSLISRARKQAAVLRVELPTAYRIAGIVATLFAVLAVVNSIAMST